MRQTSQNKRIVETYRRRDLSKIDSLVADDVEWVEWADGVPSTGSRSQGKTAIIENVGDDRLRNELSRMTEEGNVVIAEGICHITKKDGSSLNVRFCNIFELENGKIRRQDSLGALLKDSP